jgi:hypothetical protein
MSVKKHLQRGGFTEEVHDEVLARLLDLNQKRHEAEILGGKHSETIVQIVLANHPIKLIIFDPIEEVIVKWIH